MKVLRKVYHYIRCIPKTLIFNFSYFPLRTAVSFPVLVNHRTKFHSLSGKVVLPSNARTGKIKLGFGSIEPIDSSRSRLIWNLEKHGTITFGHRNKIGTASKIHVKGHLVLGNDANFTGDAVIICNKSISFGNGVLISWQTLFMDTDFHPVIDEHGNQLNHDKSVTIGDDVWVCARTTVLKGSHISQNTIVSASANVSGTFEKDSIIGGNPAKIIGSMEGKAFKN